MIMPLTIYYEDGGGDTGDDAYAADDLLRGWR